jgi:hypothetical protein
MSLFAPLMRLRTPLMSLFASLMKLRTPLMRLFAPLMRLRTPLMRLFSSLMSIGTPLMQYGSVSEIQTLKIPLNPRHLLQAGKPFQRSGSP